MKTSRPVVQFHGVSKVYPDGTYGLRDVTLTVPQGQFCVFLGRSGAGKSTMLRIINGLIPPTQGEVLVDGIWLNRKTLKKIQSRVAMIHQHFNLVPRMTVLHNVLAGALRDLSTVRSLFYLFPRRLQQKACRLLSHVKLGEDHLYRRASQLSGGQQQRVGIARAFILDPRIVLADEPVASLDPRISHDILKLLRTAAQEMDATVLCSLHQVDLAREFADRVVGMREGKVVFDGPPQALDDAAIAQIYDGPPNPSGIRQTPAPSHPKPESAPAARVAATSHR